jgi:hypothetical protein
MLPLEADCLLVDGDELSRHPTALTILSQVLQDGCHLPKRVVLLL